MREAAAWRGVEPPEAAEAARPAPGTRAAWRIWNVRLGPGVLLLALIAASGFALSLYRFAAGIGAVSNLNQGYPWGFWIGFDVLAGIALAAGGFVVAGLMHMFGGEKYHALVRPTILTAFLGYLLFIAALLVDLGRPWSIWHMTVYWHHESPMFEVGWCAMMYTTILFLEFLSRRPSACAPSGP